MNYYTCHNDQVTGPFSVEELRAKVKRGELTLADQVCPEGLEQWISLALVLSPAAPLPSSGMTSPPPVPVPRKRRMGCGGCLITGVIVAAVLIVGLIGTSYYIIFQTALPFKWVVSAFLPRGGSIEGVHGSITSGFTIRSVRWPGPEGQMCEINDVRFKSTGWRSLTQQKELIISEVNVSKAHLYVSTKNVKTSTTHWESTSSTSSSTGASSNGPGTPANPPLPPTKPPVSPLDFKLLRIDRIHIGDVYLKDVNSGFEFAMPTLDYTGFKIQNNKVDLGDLHIESDRLDVRTDPGRTVQLQGKQVTFQKLFTGTVKPRLSKSVIRPINFTLDVDLTDDHAFTYRLIAFDQRLDVFKDKEQAEFYHIKDLPLSSYLSMDPYDLPLMVTVDGSVPGKNAVDPDKIKPPTGNFMLGATTFVVKPDDVNVVRNGEKYRYEIKAVSSGAGERRAGGLRDLPIGRADHAPGVHLESAAAAA